MFNELFRMPAPPLDSNLQWRFRFSVLTVIATLCLITWGGFVTSLYAGMAVPDWPTSFGSLDPLNPRPEWWRITPVLAEHGHRLWGALVGFLTLILAIWTWRSDRRPLVRKLAIFALFLVIFQGVLGGLRVVWTSLDLAVVHASVAQLFLATLVTLTALHAPSWLRLSVSGRIPETLPRWALYTSIAIYIQIFLGALLRQRIPGMGVEFLPATLHVLGAIAVTYFIVTTYRRVQNLASDVAPLRTASRFLVGLLLLQLALGISSLTIFLIQGPIHTQPPLHQVLINTSHLLVGALVFASSVWLTLLAFRSYYHTLDVQKIL